MSLKEEEIKTHFCNFVTIEKLIVVDTLVEALACYRVIPHLK